MRWLYLIFKELKHSSHFSILFILNLSFGLSGFVALDIFKYSLDQSLKTRSKTLLGADMALSSRRPIKEEERQIVIQNIKSDIDESQVTQLYSMIANQKEDSRLVHIKAVQNNYPFYGEIRLRYFGSITRTDQIHLHKEKVALVDPEILLQLKLEVGDKIFVGESIFRILDVIEHDSSISLTSSMAPRIYISHHFLKDTKLVKIGSLSSFSIFYKIPNMDSHQLTDKVKKIFTQVDDPQVRVYTHENASQMTGRLIDYLNDFLSLTALCALFLTCVGMGFLFHSYLKNKIREIAILRSFGVNKYKAIGVYLLQIVFLGFISFIIAFVFGWFLLYGINSTVSNILPFEISIGLTTFSISIVLAILVPLLVCLPLVLCLRNVRASDLLNTSKHTTPPFDFISIMGCIPGAIGLWILSIWQSHSFYIGTLFLFFFLTSILCLGVIGWMILKLIQYLHVKISFNTLRWAMRDLCRYRFSTLTCFLCMALGMLLLNLIPQIEASVSGEIESPEKSRLPSLFIFDIQEHQIQRLKKIIDHNNIKLNKITPMISARLLSVNDETFDKGQGVEYNNLTREKEREMRFRNRGFNVSYRNFLYDSEKTLKGDMWDSAFLENQSSLPAISVETRFADRLNFKINDILKFEIEGEKVSGIIKHIRNVNWITFEPNLFIVFQSNTLLSSMPKIFLAIIPSLPKEKKVQIQNAIVSQLPNLSVVDISRVTDRILSLSKQMTLALKFMTILCLVAGFIVLYSISSHQARTRRWDIGLLKSLGATFKQVQLLFLIQFGCIAFAACLLGLIAAIIVSFFLSYIFFNSVWVFTPYVPISTLIGGVILALIVTYFSMRKALHIPTKNLLL